MWHIWDVNPVSSLLVWTNSHQLTLHSRRAATICFASVCWVPDVTLRPSSLLSAHQVSYHESRMHQCQSEAKKKKTFPLQKYCNFLSLSLFPVSCCWLCQFWFVQLISGHLLLCAIVHAIVSTWTLLSSKWWNKGGAQSLMSNLTVCIHVSLFLPANTCCSGWGGNPPNAAYNTH